MAGQKTTRLFRDARPLRELDARTRGGIEIASPWPGARGDGRRSGRSRVPGPTKGKVTGDTTIPEIDYTGEPAIDADGRLLIADRRTRALVAIDARADWNVLTSERLVAGRLPFLPKKREHACGISPVLLDGGHAVTLDGASVVLHRGADATLVEARGAPWVGGVGQLVHRTNDGLRAIALEPPHATYWEIKLARAPSQLAFAPQAHLLVLTAGAPDTLLHRFDLANGQPAAKITLPESTAPDLVVAEDGVVFVGVGAWVTAVDAEGGVRWRESGGGAPLALAAPDASVLLVGARDGARWRLRGHEVATGRLLWSHEDARFAGLPKIDGRGLAYLRQGDDLVAIDPKTGVAFPQRVALGESDWEFAFAGPGRIFVVRRSSSGTGFLVVE